MSRALEFLQEAEGKLSITRLMFALWCVGAFVVWAMGGELTWDVILFIATLGGLKLGQRGKETPSQK